MGHLAFAPVFEFFCQEAKTTLASQTMYRQDVPPDRQAAPIISRKNTDISLGMKKE